MSESERRSSRIVTLLTRSTAKDLPQDLAWLQIGDCEGAKFHSPAPLLIRPTYLSTVVAEVAEDEPLERTDRVYLCSTCRDNLTVYLSILYAYDGAAPDAVRRNFGNRITALGDRAWRHWASALTV